LVGLGAGGLQLLVDLVLRLRQRPLAVVGGGEAFGDLLLPLLDGRHDVRPAELHHHPGHREEREALDDEGEVDIHRRAPGRRRATAPTLANAFDQPTPKVPRNGLAKISSSAMATPMIGTASSRPATMNILVCSIGVSSG